MAQPPPDLKIPSSTTTVNIRIIDTTTRISGIPLEGFVSPAIKGHTLLTAAPAFSFLIEHPSNRKLLFDLGVRKDTENFAPKIVNRLRDGGWDAEVKQGVREQLEAHGVRGTDIEGIVWSHWHWDHTGDPSTFDPHTALIVGPGFKDAFTPGYPANEESPIRESDYKNRELREISFDQVLKIGPNTFIFMGGDACHHAGEFRPSQYLPLPSSISPNPLSLGSSTPCPGSLFEDLYRDGDGTKPFYSIAKGEGAIAHNADEAERTIGKVMEADARDEVLVVMAHDDTLLDVVDFFPKYANDFKEKGWVEKGRWLFLKDFCGG
ncbi:Cytochrome P450 monooxygenase, partial [Lachnellula subtilissima]